MEPKFWIFIGAATGMPLAVEKCSFAPTIHPGKGVWVEFVAEAQLAEAEQRLQLQATRHVREVEALKHAECLCPACGADWELDAPMRCRTLIVDERQALQAKLHIATEALESIAYWKSDARVCCFPVDCHEVLAKLKAEKLPDTSIPKRKKVCLAENGLQSLMNTRCECIYCKKESEGDNHG